MWILVYLVLFVIAILGGLVILVGVVGSMLPEQHTVARSHKFAQPPEQVYQVIANFPSVPAWNSKVKQVEQMPLHEGREVWRETYQDGMVLDLEIIEAQAPFKLVRGVINNKVFKGRWVYEIKPELNKAAKLTITEYGEVPNPFFRFYARNFMEPAKHIEEYLEALAGRFKEPVNIEK